PANRNGAVTIIIRYKRSSVTISSTTVSNATKETIKKRILRRSIKFVSPFPQGSGQNRPYGMARGRGPYSSRFLLIGQVCFRSPARCAAFQDVAMVKQTVEHGRDRGAIAGQLLPQGGVGS